MSAVCDNMGRDMDPLQPDGSNKREISLGDDFGEVIVRVNRTNVYVHADGSVETHANAAKNEPGPADDTAAKGKTAGEIGDVLKDGTTPAGNLFFTTPKDDLYDAVLTMAAFFQSSSTASKATLEIGAIESTGLHKGEIYGGIYPADNKPIWFSAAPKLMDHYAAAAWAKEQGGSLPTRKQGDYLTTLKDKGGAFTGIFNRGSSFPAGFVWLAEPHTLLRVSAWCQRLSYGDQYNYDRNLELPVLSVRR